jgi:hypothetical protein
VTDKDPDKLKGPGGLSLRQVHEQVQQSLARDRETQRMRAAHQQPVSRWQRFVRFVWNKRR